MTWIIGFFTISGLSMSFWALVAVARYISEKLTEGKKRKSIDIILSSKGQLKWSDVTVHEHETMQSTVSEESARWPEPAKQELVFSVDQSKHPVKGISVEYRSRAQRVRTKDIAVIVPAHNEEVTITSTITSLKRLLPPSQIFVGSDASTDRTVEIVKSMGANVVDIRPNRGKAGVLKFLIDHFQLTKKYEVIMIVDADSEIDPHYFEHALPMFDDPEVVAVAGHGTPYWKRHWRPRWTVFFTAYRLRLYRILQATMRYAQTWRYTNVTVIIPGFASMYRSRAIEQIDITAPGLIIEDFNMTFEVHHKKLGKIAYTPKAFGISHDPNNWKDYCKQVKRWNMGYWQTIRFHGLWPSFFCLSAMVFNIEMIIASFFLMMTPLLFVWFLFTGFDPITITYPFTITLTITNLLIGVFVADYLTTVLIAAIEKKPELLIYGLGFTMLRIVDTVQYYNGMISAFFVTSDGRWTSPTRKLAMS